MNRVVIVVLACWSASAALAQDAPRPSPVCYPDLVYPVRAETRAIPSGVSLLDFLISSQSGSKIITATDVVVFSDQALTSIDRRRTVGEAVSSVDVVTRAALRLAQMLDSLTIEDGAIRLFLRQRLPSDELQIIDDLIKTLTFASLYFIGAADDTTLGSTREVLLGYTAPIRLGAYH